MGLWDDFRKFAARGNVLDMAVGIVIGISFGTVVKTFVDDVLMPPVGLVLGNVDVQNLFIVLREGTPAGPYDTVAAANAAGAVTLRYGLFLNALLAFLIIIVLMFLLVRYVVGRLEKEEEAGPAPRTCDYCFKEVERKATRCPHCTSELGSAGAGGSGEGGGAEPA